MIDTLLICDLPGPLAILDARPASAGTSVLGVPVVGGDAELESLLRRGFDHFVVAIGGLRQFALRRKLFAAAESTGLHPLTVRHPSAVCSRHATVHRGVQLLAGAIVSPLANIGENTIINTAAVIEHDCVVGRHCHIAPRACAAGNVVIGNEVHVGLGAVIREGIHIGDRAIIGAGAVVIRDVHADAVVAGVPAAELRKSTE